MFRFAVPLVALFAALPAAQAAPADDFEKLLDDAWDWRLAENPVMASRLGDRRYNDRWRDLGLDAFERRQSDRRAFLARLRAIDPEALAPGERLNYDLFRRELEDEIDGFEYRSWLMPISQRGGVQSLETTAESLRLATVQDYEDWLARMSQVPVVIEQTMALQEEGRRAGFMPPRVLMERIPPQIGAQLVETAAESPFFAAFRALPASIPEDERERIVARATAIIEEEIVPAYRDFQRYFTERYLPASRESIGASELPNGEAWYEYRARSFTTTSLTPDEIHRIGLEEVRRIREEMQAVIDEVGFDGSFEEFLHFLRTDPQFYYEDPDELFEAWLALSEEQRKPMDAELFDFSPVCFTDQ